MAQPSYVISRSKYGEPTMEILLLLSGPLAVGKTQVRDTLANMYGFKSVRSSDHLKQIAQNRGIDANRTNLQALGDQLDVDTDFKWIVTDVATPSFANYPEQRRWLVDAVRKVRQVDHFRNAFARAVYHIHLTASEEALATRYNGRLQQQPDQSQSIPYEQAIDHENERAARGLGTIANTTINTTTLTPAEVVAQIIAALSI